MKKSLAVALLTVAAAAPSFADPAGQTPQGEGKIYHDDDVMVVRKTFGPEKPMKKHNHEGDEIILTLVKGEGHFTLNDDEKHVLKSGDVLIFDGDNFISGEFPEETMIVVTLVDHDDDDDDHKDHKEGHDHKH